MVCMVFGVLFGFRRSDFRSSDYSPINALLTNEKGEKVLTVKQKIFALLFNDRKSYWRS